jgi:hypothetical protein
MTDLPARITVVDTYGDMVNTADALANIEDPPHHIIVRPTPGARTRKSLAADLLQAAGKIIDPERDRGPAIHLWHCATAWLHTYGTSDLIVDRAHLLPTSALSDLATAASRSGAHLWLIDGESSDRLRHRAAGRDDYAQKVDLTSIKWEQFLQALPTPPAPEQVPTAEPPPWPTLPSADFPTFLAACHDHLEDIEFDRVRELFTPAATRTHDWLVENEDLFAAPGDHLTDRIVRWLRDVHLGPLTDPVAALITLRATQVALFRDSLFLNWNTRRLGRDPHRRLVGNLTESAATSLNALASTEQAAAAALSLHLNRTPAYFECWRVGDLSEDGAVLREPAEHHHFGQTSIHSPFAGRNLDINHRDRTAEVPCQGPVRVPEHARTLLQAHATFRRLQHAREDEAFFDLVKYKNQPHPRLRIAATTAAGRINTDLPWLHGDNCRYGTDQGPELRRDSWLTQRGLEITRLPVPPPGWVGLPRSLHFYPHEDYAA